MAQPGGLEDGPTRVLPVPVWHQTRPRNRLGDFADPAGYGGRYNSAGDAGVWWVSLTERGA